MSHPRPWFLWALAGAILAFALTRSSGEDPAVTSAQDWLKTLPALHARMLALKSAASDSAAKGAQSSANASRIAQRAGARADSALTAASTARDSVQVLLVQRDSLEIAFGDAQKANALLEGAYALATQRGDSLEAALRAGSQHLSAVIAVKTPSHWHLGATVGPTVSEKGLSLVGVTVGVTYTP